MGSWDCFMNVSQALQDIISKFAYVNVISGIVYFLEIILESSQNSSGTTPWTLRCSDLTVHNRVPDYNQYDSPINGHWRHVPMHEF